MDCSSDYGTPLYSYHPYKKISANRSTERITGRGSKVFQTQQTKEVMPLTNLLFGKEFNRVVEDGCARWAIAHSAFVRIERDGATPALGRFLRPWIKTRTTL